MHRRSIQPLWPWPLVRFSWSLASRFEFSLCDWVDGRGLSDRVSAQQYRSREAPVVTSPAKVAFAPSPCVPATPADAICAVAAFVSPTAFGLGDTVVAVYRSSSLALHMHVPQHTDFAILAMACSLAPALKFGKPSVESAYVVALVNA